jgi:3-polyprenyl-4-hydroxybenzoate decarboxylase
MPDQGHISERIKPKAFGDLRGWIQALREAGELHEINAEVDWDGELGAVTRRAFGQALR